MLYRGLGSCLLFQHDNLIKMVLLCISVEYVKYGIFTETIGYKKFRCCLQICIHNTQMCIEHYVYIYTCISNIFYNKTCKECLSWCIVIVWLFIYKTKSITLI